MARSARALVVEMVADVTDFVRGTQQADDALGDFVRDADRDLDRLEDSAKGVNFDGLARNAEQSFDKIGRSLDESADKMERRFDNLSREAKKSFDKIEHSADDAADDMGRETFGEAGREAGQEFATNVGTAVAAGDMSAVGTDSASALVGAFSSFPGFGIMFTPIALAATIFFANIKKQAEQAAAQLALAFERTTASAFESLNQSLRGASFVQLITDLGGGKPEEGVKKLNAALAGTGVTVQDIQRDYLAGGDALEKQIAKLRTIQTSAQNTTIANRASHRVMTDTGRAVKNVADQLETANRKLGEGVQLGGELNSIMTSKDVTKAVDERAGSLRSQAQDMNSMAQSQERINGGFTDPRIARAIRERTQLLHDQEVQARKVASAVRGTAGTVVGGRALGG